MARFVNETQMSCEDKSATKLFVMQRDVSVKKISKKSVATSMWCSKLHSSGIIINRHWSAASSVCTQFMTE